MTSQTDALPALEAPRPDGERRPPMRLLPMLPALPALPVDAMLRAQHTLTAVDRFTAHQEQDAPRARYYRDLIPLERPRPGEQYAFEVDLDRCTGCKACVSACHTLNGLDEGEMWRTVGLLHGGSAAAPAQQTVTTSCHHCVDPACLRGCPTQAYEKHPLTGIVEHLDDQCIGCQYCTLMCPYDAPKYNRRLGIVRKCDMCSDRLAHGEAPACVAACPSGAIAIRIAERESIVAASDAQRFLPGAPSPEHTLPATQYKTARALPSNLLPADFYTTRPEHGHPPLVVMLTLTQLAVGAFGTALLLERASPSQVGSALAQTVLACALAVLALGASVLHLGRPWLAWRAILGLRTSWLSREALAFGLFTPLAIAHGLFTAAPIVRGLAALTGVLGVYCSVMVYVATRREQWSAAQTGLKFFGTTLVLGSAAVFAVSAMTLPLEHGSDTPRALLWIVLAGSAIKLALEASALLRARDRRSSAVKRMALVMLGDLAAHTGARFACGIAGGVLLPLAICLGPLEASATRGLALVLLGLVLAGELLERYLFFRAAPASRMPGGLR
jgi:Fe-S-cluster-containing dehydrogenase component/DMSO reductase anchor subunit